MCDLRSWAKYFHFSSLVTLPLGLSFYFGLYLFMCVTLRHVFPTQATGRKARPPHGPKKLVRGERGCTGGPASCIPLNDTLLLWDPGLFLQIALIVLLLTLVPP